MLNKSISELESSLKEKEARLKQVFKQLESEKSTNESLVLQLANSMSEMKSLRDSFYDKETLLTEQVTMH
jgi:septal ring factor EnvC (AmiA/AmiB activator)